jgi:nitrogen fixation protein FixH
MAIARAQKQFTGKHMLIAMISFFGVIFGVNFTMAYLANSTWSGLVVANGYVASQSFDKDLAKSLAQEAMGWTVGFSHADNRLRLTFLDARNNKIDGLTITGKLERPTTDSLDQALVFTGTGSGVYSAPANLVPGIWEVEIDARGGEVSGYKKIFRFIAKE